MELSREVRQQVVYWSLDLAMLVDAIRFKVLSIQRRIADEIRKVGTPDSSAHRHRAVQNGSQRRAPRSWLGPDDTQRETDVKCYVCRNCGRAYNDMEVMETVDPDVSDWRCQDCNTRLEYDADAQKTSQEYGERLNRQLAPFKELLRALHDVKIPTCVERGASAFPRLPMARLSPPRAGILARV